MRIRNSFVAVAVTAAATIPSIPAMAGPNPTPGTQKMSATNTQNLTYAAHTEAAAHLQYFGYASVLPGDKEPMAGMWRAVGRVEAQDHWGHSMDLLKMFNNDPAHDVQVAITAYQQTVNDEKTFMAHAPKGADLSELRAVAGRHDKNLGLLRQALSALQGKGQVPAAPKVDTVEVNKADKPKFTGTFYTKDLVGDANSALADTAWNAAVNDRVARTAVDKGQATLGQLMTGLARQEEEQNWPSLANMAGYVGGESANLKASIAGEKGAIDMYGRFASQAGGGSAVASALKEFGEDEEGHLKAFTYELNHL